MKVCKDCERRYIGCHAECETYLAERAEHDKTAEIVKKNKTAECEVYSYKVEAIIKRRRREHRP